MAAALALALGASSARAHAQGPVELRGRVVDSLSGAPLVDAILRVPALRRYTLTDADGRFLISNVPRGVQRIIVVHLGYGERVRYVEAQPDRFHVLRIEPEPIRLDPLLAADTRHVERLVNRAAQLRATLMSGAPRLRLPPVFWNSWNRDQILASGIAEPLSFLSAGPPRVSIRKCVGLDMPADRLCVGIPFNNVSPPGYAGNPAVWTPRVTNTERLRQGGRIRVTPPSTSVARVYLDDRSLGPLETLRLYSMDDIHRVETYGYRGEYGIRFYTAGYLKLVAAGVITPDTRAEPPETYEFRRR